MKLVVEEIRAMRRTLDRSNRLLVWQNWITLGTIIACLAALILR